MSEMTHTAPMPGSTPAMDHAHGGHDHGGMMGGCKISMLWNWSTIDSCFIAESWHIQTNGMFAGSCIGVILLVILLEALRRAGKEYDRSIVQRAARLHSDMPAIDAEASAGSAHVSQPDESKAPRVLAAFRSSPANSVRPTVMQQSLRALLHTMQFAVAYFVMLLAMYFNGYIIICIFIGAYLGSFLFQWEPLASFGKDEQTRAGDNPTVCCG